MATMFKKGDVVKVVAVVPRGPVQALRMSEDGQVQYLISWVDSAGIEQTRWFDEVCLVGE